MENITVIKRVPRFLDSEGDQYYMNDILLCHNPDSSRPYGFFLVQPGQEKPLQGDHGFSLSAEELHQFLYGTERDRMNCARVRGIGGTEMNKNVLYPDIEVQLSGTDGNAFAVMGKVRQALKSQGVPNSVVEEFLKDAMSGDYNHLLTTCAKYVTVR